MAAAKLAVAAAVLLTFSFFYGTESQFLCKSSSCRGDSSIAVRFPFRLRNWMDSRCGFQPDFDLFCNNRRQTILNLPNVGDLAVLFIDYKYQILQINDPDQCLPKRLLIDSFDLQNSPFSSHYRFEYYTVFNCSDSVESLQFNRIRKIECMSGGNYSVFAVKNRDLKVNKFPPSRCEVIARRKLPMRSEMEIEQGMVLKWSDPDCRDCERRGGDCGFKSNSSSAEIACFNLPKSRLSRAAKYGLIIGVVIPGLLFLIGLGCYICGKFKAFFRPNNPTTSLSLSMGHEPTSTKAGLDKPTIESFPKTLLGESRRLPKPADTTCAICLSEYQSKETIRTIPDCDHYFHANCIDEWLKLNATCPVCRNSPEDSSFDSTRSVSISVSMSPQSVASLPRH